MGTATSRFATVTIRGDRFGKKARKVFRQRVGTAATRLRNQVVRNLSTPGRGNGPSHEGEYPHAWTGRLRSSIFQRMEGELSAVVGTNLLYGLFLEYGVAGGKTITAGAGKTLHWIDPRTGQDVFRKSVRQGAIRGRSFLRRTLFEMREELTRVIGGDTSFGGLETDLGFTAA